MNRESEVWYNVYENARHLSVTSPRYIGNLFGIHHAEAMGFFKQLNVDKFNQYIISDNTDSLCTVVDCTILLRTDKFNI